MAGARIQALQDVYDPKSMLDETNFYHQRHGGIDYLTKNMVWVLGSYTKRYPISMMTMGKIAPKGASVAVKDVQFKYPTMGKLDKASKLGIDADSVNGGTFAGIGLGNGEFVLPMEDNWIKRSYVIVSPRGVQAYVMGDGEFDPTTGCYLYKCQLDAVSPDAVVPASELTAGVAWAELNVQVAESQSRSTESKMVAPGEFKNQLGFIRAGMSWAGNSANKVMKIDINVGDKTINLWMDFFMWQFERRWLEEMEHAAWYSRYNRKANGSIALKDPMTGKPIPRSSGILEQIRNTSTYTKLTYASLSRKIGQALFDQTDADNMSITLYTGKGGIEEMDNAMKEASREMLQSYDGVADKFVKGNDYNLMLHGFFAGFYHIHGYTIKVVYNPIFDNGAIANAQAASGYTHPESGYPLESYRMVFIDNEAVDGQPNLRHVYEEGRAFKHGVVRGMSDVPRSLNVIGDLSDKANIPLLSDAVDESSYHRFASTGFQLLRGNRCFDLKCVRAA